MPVVGAEGVAYLLALFAALRSIGALVPRPTMKLGQSQSRTNALEGFGVVSLTTTCFATLLNATEETDDGHWSATLPNGTMGF